MKSLNSSTFRIRFVTCICTWFYFCGMWALGRSASIAHQKVVMIHCIEVVQCFREGSPTVHWVGISRILTQWRWKNRSTLCPIWRRACCWWCSCVPARGTKPWVWQVLSQKAWIFLDTKEISGYVALSTMIRAGMMFFLVYFFCSQWVSAIHFIDSAHCKQYLPIVEVINI